VSRFSAFLLTMALAALGCGKGKAKDGASCDEVGARFLAVAKQQLDSAQKAGEVDARTRTRVENHVPAIRDAMVRACKENGWDAPTRSCFAAADDDGKMKACYQAMAPEQRALLEKSAAGKLAE
jgi:hypothetical protein